MKSYIEVGEPCNSSYTGTIEKRMHFILKKLKTPNIVKILDIGTGFGRYSHALCDRAEVCIGIDVIEKNIACAKKSTTHENEHFIVMSGETLAFHNNIFHTVIMIECIEHITYDIQALKEVHRVLKPGGRIIVTFPNKYFPFETHGIKIGRRIIGSFGIGFPVIPLLPEVIRQHITNARVYSIHSIKKLLEDNGFRILDIEYIGPNFDTLRKHFLSGNKIIHAIQKKTDSLEKSPTCRKFLTTIIIEAERDEQ